jgi:HEAT repeat protein
MKLAWGFLALVLALPLRAQEFEEVRFDRVYLRNGNFIDGKVLARDEHGVTLRIKAGEISLRDELIDRDTNGALRIVVVKIRSLKEKPPPPPPIPPTKPAEPTLRDPFVRPPAEKPPEETPRVESGPRTVEPVETDPAIRNQVNAILRRLGAAKKDEKNNVIQDLIPLGEPAALYLASALEDFPPESRGYIAVVLCQMNQKKVLPFMKKFLKSPDASFRTQAAAVVGSTGEPGDAEDLHPLALDPDSMVRATVVMALQKLKNPRSLRAVAGACLDPEESVRSRAIEALFDLARSTEQEPEILSTLRDALDRSRGAARVDLVAAVGRAGGKPAWEIMEPYLRDDVPAVRAQALSSLAALGAEEAADSILARFAVESEDAVRQQLAFAAEKLRIRRAVPHMIGWLEGEEKSPSKEAVHRSLKQITGQRLPLDHAAWAQWWEKAKPSE